MLNYTDPIRNNHKFYEITVNGDTVDVRYGRIDTAGQHKTYTGGQAKADSLKNAKFRKGYTEFRGAAAAVSSGTVGLREASRKGLVAEGASADDQRVADLIDLLVSQNRHQIVESSGGTINVTDGQVTTPLGLLSQDAITEARSVLSQIKAGFPPVNVKLLETYLRLVPQRVPTRAGWHETFLSNPVDFDRQSLFLDQLEASVQFASAQNNVDVPSLAFRYRIAPVDDDALVARVQRDYDATSNAGHRGAYGAKVKALYTLHDTQGDADFDTAVADLGNVRQMWHGTRAFNILSLAARGFILPRGNANLYTAGAMFGHGLYLSEQSTKSANYSRGGMWSTGRDSRWFMLRCDVAMGREFWPNKAGGSFGSYTSLCDRVLDGQVTDDKGRRFNSINVKAGTCGVINHEAVIANLNQVKPRYLVEFCDR